MTTIQVNEANPEPACHSSLTRRFSPSHQGSGCLLTRPPVPSRRALHGTIWVRVRVGVSLPRLDVVTLFYPTWGFSAPGPWHSPHCVADQLPQLQRLGSDHEPRDRIPRHQPPSPGRGHPAEPHEVAASTRAQIRPPTQPPWEGWNSNARCLAWSSLRSSTPPKAVASRPSPPNHATPPPLLPPRPRRLVLFSIRRSGE